MFVASEEPQMCSCDGNWTPCVSVLTEMAPGAGSVLPCRILLGGKRGPVSAWERRAEALRPAGQVTQAFPAALVVDAGLLDIGVPWLTL